MDGIIKLNSRGEENNYLKKLKRSDGKESKTFVLKVSSPQVRVGRNENNHNFIEPTGGPMLIEGFKCDNIEAVIKSIDFTIGYGYTITFE